MSILPLTANCTVADVWFGDEFANAGIGFLQVWHYVSENVGYKWVLVCSDDDTQYENTNNGAIHAACRQLGFVNATGNYTAK